MTQHSHPTCVFKFGEKTNELYMLMSPDSNPVVDYFEDKNLVVDYFEDNYYIGGSNLGGHRSSAPFPIPF